jgi:hypothetical protein
VDYLSGLVVRDILTAVNVKITVFWNVAPCILVDYNQCFIQRSLKLDATSFCELVVPVLTNYMVVISQTIMFKRLMRYKKYLIVTVLHY